MLHFVLSFYKTPKALVTYNIMEEQLKTPQLYSIDAVMYDSKKKKSPNMQMEEKEYEENEKGKKVMLF